jgi:hypothetical protein
LRAAAGQAGSGPALKSAQSAWSATYTASIPWQNASMQSLPARNTVQISFSQYIGGFGPPAKKSTHADSQPCSGRA